MKHPYDFSVIAKFLAQKPDDKREVYIKAELERCYTLGESDMKDKVRRVLEPGFNDINNFIDEMNTGPTVLLPRIKPQEPEFFSGVIKEGD